MDYDTDDKSMAKLRRNLRIAREEYYRYKRLSQGCMTSCYFGYTNWPSCASCHLNLFFYAIYSSGKKSSYSEIFYHYSRVESDPGLLIP